MNFIPLTAREMTPSFFSRVFYAVWNTCEYRNDFYFLGYDGEWYALEYTEELEELFPVIKNLKWFLYGWEDWTWYYMGKREGAVFVHEFILNAYKKYAGINDNFIEHGPNYEAAEKALKKFKLTCAEKFLSGLWIYNFRLEWAIKKLRLLDDEYIAGYIAYGSDYDVTEEALKKLRINRVWHSMIELDKS